MPREIRAPRTDFKHDDYLTTHEVAHYIKVNPSSVNKWVKEERIKAFRTPGGHRRIKVSDLHAFLLEHEMPVPNKVQAAMDAAPPPSEPAAEPAPVKTAAKRAAERTNPGTKAALRAASGRR